MGTRSCKSGLRPGRTSQGPGRVVLLQGSLSPAQAPQPAKTLTVTAVRPREAPHSDVSATWLELLTSAFTTPNHETHCCATRSTQGRVPTGFRPPRRPRAADLHRCSWETAHVPTICGTPVRGWSRCAATACWYHQVEAGDAWPRNVDRTGRLAGTSVPSRYQRRKVFSTNVCRLCGIPHNRHYADGWVMRPAVAFPQVGTAELVLQSA